MIARKFPLSILTFRRSFPTAAVVVRSAFATRVGLARSAVTSRTFSSAPDSSDKDFEPKVVVPPSFEEIKAKLQELVTNNKVVLFMKGSPTAPQCGFSRQVVQVLGEEGLGDYVYVDILKSELIRESVKKFSDWPTIPQLYIGGEFVGGCDITKEMHKAGELRDLLIKAGVELSEKPQDS
jgi:monothiol glutaredoxin